MKFPLSLCAFLVAESVSEAATDEIAMLQLQQKRLAASRASRPALQPEAAKLVQQKQAVRSKKEAQNPSTNYGYTAPSYVAQADVPSYNPYLPVPPPEQPKVIYHQPPAYTPAYLPPLLPELVKNGPKCFEEGMAADELEECLSMCNNDNDHCPTFDASKRPAVCTLVGDPHIRTWDSPLKENAHAFGKLADYWVFKSAPLSVQARYSSTRSDHKGFVSGVALTGPLFGRNESSNTSHPFNVLEIPVLSEGTVLKLNGGPLINPECLKSRANAENNFGSCIFSMGHVTARYGPGPRVSKFFDAAWHLDSDGNNVTVRKFSTKTMTVAIELGGEEIAFVIVNNGQNRQNIMLTAQHGFLDQLFAGNVSGHCGNANGDASDDKLESYDLGNADYIPAQESLFSSEHPLQDQPAVKKQCTQESEYRDVCKEFHKTLDLDEFTDRIEDCVMDCCAAGHCPVEDVEDPPDTNCPSPQMFRSCGFWGDPHFSNTFVTDPAEHGARANTVEFHGAGLYSLFKSKDDAERDIEAQAFFCDSNSGTTSVCGIAVRQGDNTATWVRPAASGPPSFGGHLVNGECIHGDCTNNALELTLNGRRMAFEELGRGKLNNKGTDVGSPPPESLKNLGCFKDDEHRNLPHLGRLQGGTQEECSKICAMKGHTLMGLEWGGECWCGDQLKSYSQYTKVDDQECSGMQDYCAGGQAAPLCGNGWRLAVSEITPVPAGGFAEDNFFAQQHVNPHFTRDVVAPTCVGDHEGDVLVKTALPLFPNIYEPIVTLEVSLDTFNGLQSDNQLCMASSTDSARGIAPVDSKHSVFSTKELRQLCEVCGLLGKDVGEGDFHGCNNPSKDRPPTLGSVLCEERKLLDAANEACTDFSGEPDWLNACLIEYCNDDAPDVQAFIKAEHDDWLIELQEEELARQAAEAARQAEIQDNINNPKFLGCFKDTWTRALRHMQWKHGWMSQGWTASECVKECSTKGFKHAALQYGGECWCDNQYHREGDHSQASESDCRSMQAFCDGWWWSAGANKGLPCGGGWRNAVYCVEDCDASKNTYTNYR